MNVTPKVSPAHRLLERLEGVRENGHQQYLARCPAHDDKSPSLSIRELDDRLLIHCFAGCDASEVMGSIGLSLGDLYEQRDYQKHIRIRDRWDPVGLLKLLEKEARIVLMAATDIHEGNALIDDDLARLRKAYVRIGRVVEVTR